MRKTSKAAEEWLKKMVGGFVYESGGPAAFVANNVVIPRAVVTVETTGGKFIVLPAEDRVVFEDWKGALEALL